MSSSHREASVLPSNLSWFQIGNRQTCTKGVEKAAEHPKHMHRALELHMPHASAAAKAETVPTPCALVFGPPFLDGLLPSPLEFSFSESPASLQRLGVGPDSNVRA